MFGFVRKVFIASLANEVNASSHIKAVSLSNQKCESHPTIMNLRPNEYTQVLRYYPISVNSGRCVWSCNTLNNLSNKVCVPNKAEDLNPSVFNMITGINESNTLAKHTSTEYKCNLMEESVIQIKSGITINVRVSVIIKKKSCV